MSEPKATQGKKPVRVEIKVEDAVAGGTYANLCLINHSDAEFVLDFVFIQPGRPKAKVSNRLIMSPKNAKRMMMLMQQQVKNYEKRFGELDITPPLPSEMPKMEIN